MRKVIAMKVWALPWFRVLLLVGLGGWPVAEAAAQARKGPPPFQEVVKHSASIEPATARRGETVLMRLVLQVPDGYYTYPTEKSTSDVDGDQQYDAFDFQPTADVVFVDQLIEPPTKTKPGAKGSVRILPGNQIVWERPLVVRPDARPGQTVVSVVAPHILVCDASHCYPPQKLVFSAPLTITTDEPTAVDAKYTEAVNQGIAAHREWLHRTLEATRTALASRDDRTVESAVSSLAVWAAREPSLPDINMQLESLRESLRAESLRSAQEALARKDLAALSRGIAELARRAPQDPSLPQLRKELEALREQADALATVGLDYPTADEYKESLAQIKDQLVRTDAVAGDIAGSQRGDLLAFILAGIFWGAVSLITPCVFPMIPITVSFFLKQSEKEHHRPVTMALVYCGTIVVVLTIAAVLLLSFFRLLSVSPYMNFALGALFIFFALSLFGMYDIELPSGLARFTAAREGQGGLLGTMFMALTFTIISFACVAPFLGGFGGTAAGGQFTWSERVLGGLAFSVTFAAPFFVLAVFPSLLKKLPKSGSWLNSVKVVMGFLELAAAIKFFRAGELVLIPTPAFFTYDVSLGLYVAIAFLCGLYLLNFYRLPHDSPLENIGVVRMLIGLLFIALGLYLVPGLFKQDAEGKPQRPNGTVYAWIDSFLLPEPSEDKRWTGNLELAIREARKARRQTGKPQLVFVDFTGETCTNCKINEKSVFPRPEVRELMDQYRLVQLYTDKVPNAFYAPNLRLRFGSGTARQQEDAQANLAFQKEAFNTEQLPLYVILEPRLDGKVDIVGIYSEGKINDENAFAQFLQKPLEAANGQRADAAE
jgi:thiol:disulfide interchange protein DsbD